VILDNNNLDKVYTGDKAEGAIGNINIRRIKQDTSPYNTLITLELALAQVKSIDVFGL
jgi:hypothetical protein